MKWGLVSRELEATGKKCSSFRECAFRKTRCHRLYMHRGCEGVLPRRAHDLHLQRGRLQAKRDKRCIQAQKQALEA